MVQARSMEGLSFSDTSSYSLPSGSITGLSELRIDAAHYSPELLDAIRILQESGMTLKPLADITDDVFMPTRFKRVYVGKESGVPFLQGSHIVQFRPTDIRYLSPASYHPIERLQIQAGWLLVTRSGTVGRITVCPDEWNGWVASEHILRVIPNEEVCPGSYLSAFLASPFGQVQLKANIHGAVVDELTVDQLRKILIPIPRTEEDAAWMESVDHIMKESITTRDAASSMVNRAVTDVVGATYKHRNESSGFTLRKRYLVEPDIRMDAGHYNPAFLSAIETLEKEDTVRLGEVAKVFMPSRFKRVYVDSQHGVPFLQGSHVVCYQPDRIKHLAQDYVGPNKLTLSYGWILITRSGTVGRVMLCPKEWDGWSATEHIIRVIPEDNLISSGFLCAFLASPLGQIQLTSQIHGAVVDHLTEDQVRRVVVPIVDEKTMLQIDSAIKEGMSRRSKAVAAAMESINAFVGRFGRIPPRAVREASREAAETDSNA